MKKLVLFAVIMALLALPVAAHPPLDGGDITPQDNDHECSLSAGDAHGYAEVVIGYGHDDRWPHDIHWAKLRKYESMGSAYGIWNYNRFTVTLEIWQWAGSLPTRIARKVCR